jgi:hypothetical protein
LVIDEPAPAKRGGFSDAPPHEGQLRVIHALRNHKIVVHSPGRRWGKSTLRKFLALEFLGRRQGWVQGCFAAQSHSEATNIWESDCYDFEQLKAVAGKQNDDQRRFIDFNPVKYTDPDTGIRYEANKGGRIWYPSLSADSHRHWQGHGLAFAILDECSHIPFAAWNETVRPMLADTGGPALLIGTPIPQGIGWAWFKEMWHRGNPKNPNRYAHYLSTTGPSEENPHIDHAEVRAQRQELIDSGQSALAACLYDGAFVEADGAVFPNLDKVFVLTFTDEGNVWVGEAPTSGVEYVAGLDYGKISDSTVLSVFRVDTGDQVLLCRLRGDYSKQLPTIERLLRRFGDPMIYAEGREGAGLINELLRTRHGTRVREVKWSRGGPADKEANVLRGVDLFQRAGWRMLNVEWQRKEFAMFMRERIGEHSAGFRYEAPPGFHDDSVAAALYACRGLPLVAERVVGPRVLVANPDYEALWQTQHCQPTLEAGFDLRAPVRW